MNYKFYKEEDNRWYIDLPEWTGSKADLEMVGGADTMLDYMAEGEFSVTLSISETEIDGYDLLSFVRETIEWENGAFYFLKAYNGIELNLEVWLCDVTRFVFNGNFPKELYICKV